MTMRTDDVREIVKGTVEHLRVRCAHRGIYMSDDDIRRVENVIGDVLQPLSDDSADTGGEWNNE